MPRVEPSANARVESSKSVDAEADHDHVSNGLSKLLVLHVYLADEKGQKTMTGWLGESWLTRCLAGARRRTDQLVS